MRRPNAAACTVEHPNAALVLSMPTRPSECRTRRYLRARVALRLPAFDNRGAALSPI
jgi:hypothetical protein